MILVGCRRTKNLLGLKLMMNNAIIMITSNTPVQTMSIMSGTSFFVRATPNFGMRDASVLEDTNKPLCPGNVIKYRLRHISEKPKSSTIVMLFDPSTPDKMSITLANGDILRPFVHDVKREHMYAGGGGGLLFEPVSTWMKFEECILNLGSATSVKDNKTFVNTNDNTDEENSMDDSQDLVQGANCHNF
jgi:hypothetical protein